MLAERYSVETLEVFGSYVRDEQKKDSDLDILVTFKEEPPHPGDLRDDHETPDDHLHDCQLRARAT